MNYSDDQLNDMRACLREVRAALTTWYEALTGEPLPEPAAETRPTLRLVTSDAQKGQGEPS